MKTVNDLIDEVGGLDPGLEECVRERFADEFAGTPEDQEGLRYGLEAVLAALATGAVTRAQAESIIGFASGDPDHCVDEYPGELVVHRYPSGPDAVVGRLRVDRAEYAEQRQAVTGNFLSVDGSWCDPGYVAQKGQGWR